MLTSSATTSDMQLAKSYTDVTDYLIKPINKAVLARLLEEVQNLKDDTK